MPSRVVGRYALFESLGAGGSASVWLGIEQNTATPRALKRLHDSQRNSNAVARLLDEVRLAKLVSHPNVVQVVELVSDGEDLLAVLEYVHGEPLSRLANERAVPPEIVSAIGLEFLAGLGAAHAARDADGHLLSLVHRDVTPDNILVGEDGHARLTDFGVAKAAGRLQDTKNGGVRGKLAYLAPEQIGGDVTAQTDLYAAGLVIWQLLVGRQPIQGDNEAEMIAKALSPNIPPPGISPALDAVVMKAISPEPADRYATAEEFASALAAAQTPASTQDVADWVRANAAETLERRAQIIQSMVAPSSRAAVVVSVPPAPSSLWSSHKVGVALMACVAMSVFGLFGRWVLAEPAAPPAPEVAVSKPTQAAGLTVTSGSASVTPAAVPPPPASASSARPLVKVQKGQPASKAPPAAPKCNQPWYIDAQGIRRYDPNCM